MQKLWWVGGGAGLGHWSLTRGVQSTLFQNTEGVVQGDGQRIQDTGQVKDNLVFYIE